VIALAAAGALCAALPALLFLRNLGLYREPPGAPAGARPAVSVLVPARDEERGIAAAVLAALGSEGVEVEVLVLDDGSTDGTAAAVAALAARDRRVRLLAGEPLPPGWIGKVWACAQLARAARSPLLAFVDADVRLAPGGLARAAAFLDASGADLASGFPRQETVTSWERLLLPLMHFVLLGFLPIARMRASRHPAYGAGCGQLLVVRRAAYEAAGGHAAVRGEIHDGLALPRALRRAGLSTDLFDATSVASCRMYRSAGEVWRGLQKNATAGLAAPGKIVPATLLLGLGQIAPPALLLTVARGPAVLALAALGTAAAYLPRLAAARRFRQPWGAALLHPLAVLAFLAVQWAALGRQLAGRPAAWKGRRYLPRASRSGAAG